MSAATATSPSSPSIKNESLLDFLGTIGRRKKIKEVEELTEEGKAAIDGSTVSPAIDNLPEEFVLDEFEERSMIEPSMYENKNFQELIKILINWINDELSDQRIIVRNLEEDLYDGQILGKLVEKLSGQKLDVIEVTQNEDLQKSKLRAVLDTANRLLGLQSRWTSIKWTVEGNRIHNKNLVQIIHLLVTLIRHYRAPIRLPENVVVNLVVVQKRDGHLHTRMVSEQLTGSYDELGMRIEPRDAFDTLFDHAPDKLQIVKKSLVNFVNRHLNKVNIECYSGQNGVDLDPNQFSDGLLLIFLMGMVEGYFVPLGNIFTTTTDPLADATSPKETALSPDNYINTSPIHKLHNVQVAFQLMEDAGIQVRQKVRAEDIANADLKSTLRVLYMIFTKYKHL
ncbi:beta-parvin-like protein [Dinothrombium tinctorium]|uniref:Beta-parvin-like protein n=1 Tax=Dinothrombium tinctorium TaxID=1965070 RepID=A0A443RQ40_9ACAR|nr:beta-parvin-like protein [Dinothrombium tinctorium]